MNDIKDKIIAYTKELRLPTMRKVYGEKAIEASQANSSYENYLLSLLEQEYLMRVKNRKTQRVRRARFPYKKYIEDLKREELPDDAQDKLASLERLDFIRSGQNVVLAGNPGTGNTHIAIGLGIKACLDDYSVLFTHLSLRAGRKSTIITTNLSFDRWSEIFGDPVLTAAMVDRLTHKAYLVNMNGESYRVKETKQWIAQ